MAALLLSAAHAADLGFASVFGDDMVLQRDASAAVYGFAEAGSQIMVLVSDGEVRTAMPAADGSWKVLLKPRPARLEPLNVSVVQGANRASISGVVWGDVWLCSGQSNMELPLSHTLTRNQS